MAKTAKIAFGRLLAIVDTVAWTIPLAISFLWLTSGTTMAQSYSSASTPFNWIDASSHTRVGYNTAPYKFNGGGGCGTTPPTLDDTISDQIPIGFTFRYGSTDYTQLRIQTNGRLQFNNSTCGYGTASIGPPQTYPNGYPNASMNNTMKVFGVDLDPTNRVDSPNYPTSTNRTNCNGHDNCYVRWASIGTAPNRQFVVTWWHVPEWVSATNTSGSFDIQVVLNEDGSFVYQYGTVTHGGTGTAQIGWQLTTADYAVLSFGASAEPPPNTAIVFFKPSSIANYRFDEGAWTSGGAGEVKDSSTGNRHGQSLGSAQTTTGGYICRGANIPANTSAETVDAVQTGVNVSAPGLNLSGTGTVTFWYRSNLPWSGGSATDLQLVDGTALNGQWFYLTKLASGALRFDVTDSLGNLRSVQTPPQAIAAGAWTHIAIAWNFNALAAANSDQLKIHVNGAAPTISAFTSNGTVNTQTGFLHFGDNSVGIAGPGGTVNSANGIIDEIKIFNSVLSNAQVAADLTNPARTCPTFAIHHLEIQGSASGVTCTPATLTIKACSDAPCTPYTGGISGTLSATGTPTVNWDGSTGGAPDSGFAIAVGASQTTKKAQVSTVGSVVFGMPVAPSPPPSNSTTCNFGTPSCTYTAANSGFSLSAPDTVAAAPGTMQVSAIRTADSTLVCVPAFANVTKTVTLSCAYADPPTGSLPILAKGASDPALLALNAGGDSASSCDSTGQSVNLSFNAAGTASASFSYADAGRMTISARHAPTTGTDAGLVMTGSTTFVSAPADFVFSAYPLAPTLIKAGSAFSATLTARNSAGAATPNFGKEATPEGVTLGWIRYRPTGAGASSGSFSGTVGTFTAGTATGTNLQWSEVGQGDLTATLASGGYLGSTLTASGSTGSTGAVGGRFIPDHFDTVVDQGCAAGGFTFSGQPMTLTITARNLSGGKTLNYDGTASTSPNFSKAVTLTDANSVAGGALAPTAVAASAFAAGVASTNTAFTFVRTNPDKAPGLVKLRATDADGVSSGSPATPVEGTATIRIGRLQLANAFGSEKQPLLIAVQSQYWTGRSWLLNADDSGSCTTIPSSAIILSNYRDSRGAPSATWTSTASSSGPLIGGRGTVTLGAPTGGATGSVDLAINLGGSGADQSCLAAHGGTPAALPWLRGRYGNCATATSYGADPSASASFGVYSGESRKAVHLREVH